MRTNQANTLTPRATTRNTCAMPRTITAGLPAVAGFIPLGASDLEGNLILLLVLVVLFVGTAVGFFTYAGSGIGARPMDRASGAPAARRPDDFQAFARRQPLPRDLDEVAPGVWRLNGWPPNGFNVYAIDVPEIERDPDEREEARGEGPPLVLVDSGTRYSTRRILRGLHAQPLGAVLLTHAHPDHQGAGATVCQVRDVPLWCGAADADAIEGGRPESLVPEARWNRRLARFVAGPAHPVERRLREGDRVGEFVVLETPGVTPGHISLWRESDRVLIAGDVATNQHPVLGRPGLHPQPRRSVADPVRNAESLRKLAGLNPSLVLFGHGPPLRDPGALSGLAAATARSGSGAPGR